MSNEWFIIADEQEIGPLSPAELKSRASQGSLAPNDLVRRSDMTAPIKASSIKELFTKTPNGPPPLPPVTKTISEPPPLPPKSKDDVAATEMAPKAKSDWIATKLGQWKDLSATAKISFVAGGTMVFFLFLCCGGVGMVAVSRSDVRPNTLQEDFYPFEKGTKQHTLTKLNGNGNRSVISRKEYVHEDNGSFEIRTLKCFGMPGNVSFPLPDPKRQYYRKQDGYVEIGNEGINQTVWHPVVKIGAKVGDHWEREIIPGMVERYTFKLMGSEELAQKENGFKENVKTAVIEVHSIASIPGGPSVENVEEIVLGRGLGPIKRTSWRIEDGKRIENWNEVLVPVK